MGYGHGCCGNLEPAHLNGKKNKQDTWEDRIIRQAAEAMIAVVPAGNFVSDCRRWWR